MDNREIKELFNEKKISIVNVRDPFIKKEIEITSDSKPEIDNYIIDRWQTFIDNASRLLNLPSGLIMRLNEEDIEVFIRSNTKDNPYEVHEKAELKFGLYCETVIGKQQPLLVSNAISNPIWCNNNPDIDLGMISYLGYPLNWPDGEAFGTVCVLDNKENLFSDEVINFINNIKKSIEADLALLCMQKDLEIKNKNLKKTNNVRNKFLSLISHDIRGAVGTLNVFLDLIINDIDEFDKEQIKTMLTSLRNSTNKAYETLENMLEWSKNNLTGITVNKKQTPIIPIIEEVIDYFKQSITLKKLNITRNFHSTETQLYIDPHMIETALRNIISNAVKYTHNEGEITISTSQIESTYRIEITDNGIGMKPEEVEKLFSYDASHKTSGTKQEHSSGIGLILIKDFLEKNNADVKIESSPNKGTSFIIDFTI